MIIVFHQHTVVCATKGSSFLTIGLFWRGFLATCTTTVVLHFLAFLKVTNCA